MKCPVSGGKKLMLYCKNDVQSTLKPILNTTSSDNKSKCEIKMHLLKQPFASMNCYIVSLVSRDSYPGAHHKCNAVAGEQQNKFTTLEKPNIWS